MIFGVRTNNRIKINDQWLVQMRYLVLILKKQGLFLVLVTNQMFIHLIFLSNFYVLIFSMAKNLSTSDQKENSEIPGLSAVKRRSNLFALNQRFALKGLMDCNREAPIVKNQLEQNSDLIMNNYDSMANRVRNPPKTPAAPEHRQVVSVAETPKQKEVHSAEVDVVQMYKFDENSDDQDEEKCSDEQDQQNIDSEFEERESIAEVKEKPNIQPTTSEAVVLEPEDIEKVEIVMPSNLPMTEVRNKKFIVQDFGEDDSDGQEPESRFEQFKEQIETIRVIEHITAASVYDFVRKAIPKGHILRCCIRRNLQEIARPSYSLYISNTYKHLVSAKKKVMCATSHYAFSLDKDNFEEENIGKVRSNFLGTEFNGFSKGLNPSKTNDRVATRSNIVTIKYQQNLFGRNGPRKMKVIVPNPLSDGEVDYIKPSDPEQNLEAACFSKSVLTLTNKMPQWDPKIEAYVLNFNGRVTEASIKNFLIVDEGTERVRLLFGRVAKNVFNLDVHYPFSVLQAFSVVLSCFDKKLACE